MPRFALLIHESPRGMHYDFFLEDGDVLKTWALPRLPEAGAEIFCDALADHRPMYLDFEGPISGGRGTVSRYDQGTYTARIWTEVQVVVDLSGGFFSGSVELWQSPDLPGQWRFLWQPR